MHAIYAHAWLDSLMRIQSAADEARRVHFSEIAEHARSGQFISVWWVVLAVGLLLVLVAAISFRNWQKRQGLRSAPLMQFHKTAGALGLTLADQWLLVRIARQQVLPSPLTLMLSPATLRHHAEHYCAALNLPPSRAQVLLDQADDLAARLFGER